MLEAAVFDAKFFVPGQGAPFSRSRADAGGSRQRRFDVVVLVRTGALEHAAELRAGEVWSEVVALMRASSRHAIDIVARNIRRINDVPHAGGGVYLFNFFDNTPEVLPVWENSARWFVAKTKLDNSIVLQPVADTANEYAAINHARWPTWRAFLPHLCYGPASAGMSATTR